MNKDLGVQKQERWIKYAFWFIAGLLVAVVIFFLVKFICTKTSINVPENYRYAIEDHFAKNNNLWATYYVYDNYVLVTKDNGEEEPIMAYDGIDASKLTYDENDTIRTCDADSCFDYPQVLNTIKKLISTKFGREYTGK